MRFKSFAFSLSTMLALKSFITSVPVAQYCEFCILQLWLHNKMNRTHCSLTLTNTCALYCVASDSNDPVWTSLIFFKDKCCVSPSVQSVGMIIVLNSWNGRVSSSYLLPPLPKRGKKKYPQLSDEKKCIQDQGISLVLKRAALVIFWPVCRRLGLERHSQIHTGSWPDLWCLVWVWSPDSPPKSRAIASAIAYLQGWEPCSGQQGWDCCGCNSEEELLLRAAAPQSSSCSAAAEMSCPLQLKCGCAWNLSLTGRHKHGGEEAGHVVAGSLLCKPFSVMLPCCVVVPSTWRCVSVVSLLLPVIKQMEHFYLWICLRRDFLITKKKKKVF